MTLSNPTLHRVCKAVTTDMSRYFMACLHVEEEWVIGSDGRRLHGMKNPGIPPGHYTVEKNTKTKQIIELIDPYEGVYPKWRNIMPTEFDTVQEWKCHKSDGFAGSVIDLHNLVAINHKYLEPLQGATYIVGFPKPSTLNGSDVATINKAVLFVDGGFFAVIMPMQTGRTIAPPTDKSSELAVLVSKAVGV